MEMQGALRARILADAGVSALAGTKVTWVTRPQSSTLPAVVLQTISDGRPQHLKGFNALRDTRVQIDCWAATYDASKQLSEAVIAAAVPQNTSNGIIFNRAMVDAVDDGGEVVGTAFIYRVRVDLIIWWQKE